MKKYDIISIGDATIDTFLFVKDIEVKKEGEAKKAIISWGDKLPVQKLVKTVAGNAANAAVGASRLGLNTAFYTVLAHDVGGREITHKMTKEKVSSEYIVIDEKKGTNASTVLSHDGERTIFVFHEERDYKLPTLKPASWVYVTSMSATYKKLNADLVKYLDKHKAKLLYQPGTFQLRDGVKKNKELLKRTEVLSLNVEEGQSWVGENNRNPRIISEKLRELGPKVVLLTDGRNGAYSLSEYGFFYAPEFPGPRIEATGAGDSFATGYMAALAHGLSHKEAILWAPVNAMSVVGKIGPQAGLLTKKEILAKLKSKPNFKAIPVTSEAILEKIIKSYKY